MREEVIVAIAMLAISAIGSVVTKNDRKWSVVFLLAAAVAGSLIAGMGIRFREIVEGPFGFIDSALSVVSAFVLVSLLYKSGAFEVLLDKISSIRCNVLKAFATLLFIALPAMFTGAASASVLTTGAIVAKRLRERGLDNARVVGTVAIGSFLGMILPPNCIPAMIAANGAGSVLPTPYVGFFLPLLVVALPAFIAFGFIAKPSLLLASAQKGDERKKCTLELIVLLVVCIALLVEGLLSSFVYIGGNVLVFTIAWIVVLVANKGFGNAKQAIESVSEGLMDSIAPVALMLALGSFIEVSSMTGVRGIFSLWILPYQVSNVMLVLMAASIIIGFFIGTPIPAFLITYAVFPIGWLANTVVVTGCAMALAIVCLLSMRGGIGDITSESLGIQDVGVKDIVKQAWPVLALVLAMGVVMMLFGDNMTFLIL